MRETGVPRACRTPEQVDVHVSDDRRGYSWPPFEPGNTAGVTNGANSERRLAPIVATLLAELEQVAPWSSTPTFRLAAERWAWAEAECRLRREDFDVHGLTDDKGEGRAGVDRWHRAERRAQLAGEALGLTPQSMVKLLAGMSGIDGPRAQDGLEALRATGAELMAKAHARALAAVPDPKELA